MHSGHEQVLDFWFNDLTPEMWWKKDSALDQLICECFSELHAQANANELYSWRETPRGALAEVIVLDQFSRNIHRNAPKAFASDPLALALAQHAIDKRFDSALDATERGFLYLPFMHSESKLIHDHAVALYTAMGNKQNLAFELKHKAIIDRFGRYPHRNSILNRPSTGAELAFLQEPGSSF